MGTEFKVMPELLRHSSLRSTLDIYTQAVMPAKHAAQAARLSLVFASKRERRGTLVGQRCAEIVAAQSCGRQKGRKEGAKCVLFASSIGFMEIGLTALKRMAGTTRLELATSAVTGQRSNQLNYVPSLFSSG